MTKAHKKITLYLGIIGSIISILASIYAFFPSAPQGGQSINNSTGVNIGTSTNSGINVDIKK
jgi:hypothetical protein